MEPSTRAYLAAIDALARRHEREAPGSYDAHYWRIEHETGCTLTSAELHRRAMQAERRSAATAPKG